MVERDGFEPPVPLVSGASGGFLPVSVLCQRRSARLKRTGERLASDCDQSDVYVCPKKERAGMKRNPSESGTRNLADELAELRGLDATTLRQRWRVFYRTEAPARIGHALLLQSCGRLGWWSPVDLVFRGPLEQAAGGGFKAVAYRLQERVLGGLFSPKNRGPDQRVPVILLRGARYRSLSEVARNKVTPGSVLIREWHGVSHRVTVLADGVLIDGAASE
jgi:hypothetical protein